MNFEEYRKINAMNWSSLKDMNVSARLYKWRIDHPRPETPALSMGSALHTAILEPEEFLQRYVTRPAGLDFRTKAGKEWKASVRADQAILTADQVDTIWQYVKAVSEHEEASRLLEGTRREETVAWTIDSLACKGRVDAIGPDKIIDLKSTRSLEWFMRDAVKMLYHGQLAWYRDGCFFSKLIPEDSEVYIIATETAEPYDVGVFRLGPSVLRTGRELYTSLLGYWRECERSNIWLGQYAGIQPYELPPWAETGDEEGF